MPFSRSQLEWLSQALHASTEVLADWLRDITSSISAKAARATGTSGPPEAPRVAPEMPNAAGTGEALGTSAKPAEILHRPLNRASGEPRSAWPNSRVIVEKPPGGAVAAGEARAAATAADAEGASTGAGAGEAGGIAAGALAEAGLIGGVIAGSVTAFHDADQVRDGAKTAGEATAEVAVATGVGAAAGIAGVIAGAEIGATVGSVVPGAGTVAGLAAGAVVGGVVGLVGEGIAEHSGAIKQVGEFLDAHFEAPLQAAWEEVAAGVDAVKAAASAAKDAAVTAVSAVETATGKALDAVEGGANNPGHPATALRPRDGGRD